MVNSIVIELKILFGWTFYFQKSNFYCSTFEQSLCKHPSHSSFKVTEIIPFCNFSLQIIIFPDLFMLLYFRLQNQLGVSVLFTWGVISENNTNHIAIVPGGWNEDYLQDSATYVKVIKFINFKTKESKLVFKLISIGFRNTTSIILHFDESLPGIWKITFYEDNIFSLFYIFWCIVKTCLLSNAAGTTGNKDLKISICFFEANALKDNLRYWMLIAKVIEYKEESGFQ